MCVISMTRVRGRDRLAELVDDVVIRRLRHGELDLLDDDPFAAHALVPRVIMRGMFLVVTMTSRRA